MTLEEIKKKHEYGERLLSEDEISYLINEIERVGSLYNEADSNLQAWKSKQTLIDSLKNRVSEKDSKIQRLQKELETTRQAEELQILLRRKSDARGIGTLSQACEVINQSARYEGR